MAFNVSDMGTMSTWVAAHRTIEEYFANAKTPEEDKPTVQWYWDDLVKTIKDAPKDMQFSSPAEWS